MTADLFWQWNPSPGALIPVKRAGPYTVTPSNGGGFYVLWYYDRVRANGSRAMIDAQLSRLLAEPPLQGDGQQSASGQRPDR